MVLAFIDVGFAVDARVSRGAFAAIPDTAEGGRQGISEREESSGPKGEGELYEAVRSLQVAPWRHGLDSHSSVATSHMPPENPEGHWHEKA